MELRSRKRHPMQILLAMATTTNLSRQQMGLLPLLVQRLRTKKGM
jgi:hypothetical protein